MVRKMKCWRCATVHRVQVSKACTEVHLPALLPGCLLWEARLLVPLMQDTQRLRHWHMAAHMAALRVFGLQNGTSVLYCCASWVLLRPYTRYLCDLAVCSRTVYLPCCHAASCRVHQGQGGALWHHICTPQVGAATHVAGLEKQQKSAAWHSCCGIACWPTQQ